MANIYESSPAGDFWLNDVRLDGILRIIAERDKAQAQYAELAAIAERLRTCRYSAREAEIQNLIDALRRHQGLK